jgi:transposase-like protein
MEGLRDAPSQARDRWATSGPHPGPRTTGSQRTTTVNAGPSSAQLTGQAKLAAGYRHDGLTTAEREELRRLRRENRELCEERESLGKAAVVFARQTDHR